MTDIALSAVTPQTGDDDADRTALLAHLDALAATQGTGAWVGAPQVVAEHTPHDATDQWHATGVWRSASSK